MSGLIYTGSSLSVHWVLWRQPKEHANTQSPDKLQSPCPAITHLMSCCGHSPVPQPGFHPGLGSVTPAPPAWGFGVWGKSVPAPWERQVGTRFQMFLHPRPRIRSLHKLPQCTCQEKHQFSSRAVQEQSCPRALEQVSRKSRSLEAEDASLLNSTRKSPRALTPQKSRAALEECCGSGGGWLCRIHQVQHDTNVNMAC